MGGVFYHEESPNHTKRCNFLAETLREVFSYCQTFSRRLSTASLEEECPIIDDVDEEQEVVVSAVRRRAMENKSSSQVQREKAFPGDTLLQQENYMSLTE